MLPPMSNILLLMSALGYLANVALSTDTNGPKEWWETTLVYQVWPRGFQDTDGDGEGDLKGIIQRLDYIKSLGVETIWLNPIYPSPLVDAGYDVSNYTDVHPLFGTLDDFDKLLKEAHHRKLYVILDIVPNHSSDQHDWFLSSAKGIEPYTNYYIWSEGFKDETGNNIPPNNWISAYSDKEGSAWTWHDVKKQWYYHKFDKTQPDLNLRNQDVVQELRGIFTFWLNRGVDGFRISAVHYFFEDEELKNESKERNESFTFGLPENTELLYIFRGYINDWVKENNSRPKLLIAESSDSSQKLITYYGNETHEGIAPFNFHFITHIDKNSDANYIKNTIETWLQLIPKNTSTNWVLSNHDNSRVASRIGLNRVDGLHMLSLLLPGQAYTYYGEEIAMLDADLRWTDTIDPRGCSQTKDTYKEFSRDPARTPMQWDSNVSGGFSKNTTTYLPIHPDYRDRNVMLQESQVRSTLNTYKKLASLRKEPVFAHGQYDLATLNDNRVLVLKRYLKGYPVFIVVVNLGLRTEAVNLISLYPNLKNTLSVNIMSVNAINITDTLSSSNFVLTANAALVLQGEEVEPVIDTTTQASQTTKTVQPTKISETTTTTSSPTENSKTTVTTESPTTLKPITVSTTRITTAPIITTAQALETTTTIQPTKMTETTTTTTTTTPSPTENSKTTVSTESPTTLKPTTAPTTRITTEPTTNLKQTTTMNTMTTTPKTDRNTGSYNIPILTLILSTSFTAMLQFHKF